MRPNKDQHTGYNAPGFRFRFHVRSISHRSLFLPLVMKEHRKIKRLLDGESPLAVFNTDSIHDARRQFCELRKQFDFPYWAITEYHIRQRHNPDNIIPLKLNTVQHFLIDILLKRYHNRQVGRYVVTKTGFPSGLTTCIQAYITWMQTFHWRNNSSTRSSNEINLNPLKTDLCRWLHRDIVPSEKWIFLPKADARAFFSTYRCPNLTRGINLGYVHFADMHKWKDKDGSLSQQNFQAATGGVLLKYSTLVILEGNIPDGSRLNLVDFHKPNYPFDVRMWLLERYSNNPYFLDFVARTRLSHSPYIYINLDDAYFSDRASATLARTLQL